MTGDAFSKCHPWTNFLFFVGAIGCSVVIQHPCYLAASCMAAAVYLMLLKGRRGMKQVLWMIPLFGVISGMNPLFNTYGERVLFSFFGRPYTLEALYYGMAVAAIFVAMMLWFGCYSEVLTSDKFVCLFGGLIPALSLLLVMVLRMIPNLIRRGTQVSNARQSVGKGIGDGEKAMEKLSSATDILSALTDWALEGSIVTADSMRSRGYGSRKRTSFQIYRLTLLDVTLLAMMALFLAAALIVGETEAVFTPRVHVAPLNWGFLPYCAFLSIPILLQGKEALQWHISISRI